MSFVESNRQQIVGATWTQVLRRESLIFAASAILLAPVILLYGSHYWNAYRSGVHPTGFIQYDMPYYMANARQHFDDGKFSLLYSNPFSPLKESPKIYFQPITLVTAIVLYSCQPDPGTLFVVMGAVFGIVAVRISILLFDQLYGLKTLSNKLTLICFVWSAGTFAAWGALRCMVKMPWSFGSVMHPDPFDGWWFLNLGRNFCYPTESLYHAMSLGCVVLLIKKRFVLAMVCLAVLAASHPFTGTQFILIVATWMSIECLYVRNPEVPLKALVTTVLIATLHFAYYLLYLPSHQEHVELVSQWTLDWSMKANVMVPAYGIVAALALWRARTPELTRRMLSKDFNRLLLVFFFVSFLLANHEFAITPHQPLHFTRGYIWVPLFLLGAPTLIAIFDRLISMRRLGPLLVGFLMIVMVLDNAVWFAWQMRSQTGFQLEPNERTALEYLSTLPENRQIVSDSHRIGYFATVYTEHLAWHSHASNTPQRYRRVQEASEYLAHDTVPAQMDQRNAVIVLSKSNDRFNEIRDLHRTAVWPSPRYENPSFLVIALDDEPQ
ncbi:hypothetical protein N9N28_09945 [Rubripirellula amarantea]|nr:hypothetical protein [Rubripirellula amarantea]